MQTMKLKGEFAMRFPEGTDPHDAVNAASSLRYQQIEAYYSTVLLDVAKVIDANTMAPCVLVTARYYEVIF